MEHKGNKNRVQTIIFHKSVMTLVYEIEPNSGHSIEQSFGKYLARLNQWERN